MNAMYMSRSPIPSTFHEEIRAKWFKQVCVMPLKWNTLYQLNYVLNKTDLEQQESIEMLRALQHGIKIRMVLSKENTKSVDNEQDRLSVERLMLNDKLFKNRYLNE